MHLRIHHIRLRVAADPAIGGNSSSRRGSLSATAVRSYDHRSRHRRHKETRYAFDRVLDEGASQQDVFEGTTRSLVDDVLAGYNATVFAYGATGCGKTHTITGTREDPGIIFRTMDALFAKMAAAAGEDRHIECSVSYLEVYNETIRDLLNPADLDTTSSATTAAAAATTSGATASSSAASAACAAAGATPCGAATAAYLGGGGLDLREDETRVHVAGLSWHAPREAADVMRLLLVGNENRTRAPTEANAVSSRSHAVLQVHVRQRRLATPASSTAAATAAAGNPLAMAVVAGTLSIIDLAGSERASVTKNVGERLLEGANINRSLLALGNCINALCSDKPNHIPYRLVVMIANISPSSAHYEETHSTLKYANRAKNIKTKVEQNVIDVDLHVAQYPKLILELKTEIEALKRKLADNEEHQHQQQQQQQQQKQQQQQQQQQQKQPLNQVESDAPHSRWPQPAAATAEPAGLALHTVYTDYLARLKRLYEKIERKQREQAAAETRAEQNDTRLVYLGTVLEALPDRCAATPNADNEHNNENNSNTAEGTGTPDTLEAERAFFADLRYSLATAIERTHALNVGLRHNAGEAAAAICRYRAGIAEILAAASGSHGSAGAGGGGGHAHVHTRAAVAAVALPALLIEQLRTRSETMAIQTENARLRRLAEQRQAGAERLREQWRAAMAGWLPQLLARFVSGGSGNRGAEWFVQLEEVVAAFLALGAPAATAAASAAAAASERSDYGEEGGAASPWSSANLWAPPPAAGTGERRLGLAPRGFALASLAAPGAAADGDEPVTLEFDSASETESEVGDHMGRPGAGGDYGNDDDVAAFPAWDAVGLPAFSTATTPGSSLSRARGRRRGSRACSIDAANSDVAVEVAAAAAAAATAATVERGSSGGLTSTQLRRRCSSRSRACSIDSANSDAVKESAASAAATAAAAAAAANVIQARRASSAFAAADCPDTVRRRPPTTGAAAADAQLHQHQRHRDLRTPTRARSPTGCDDDEDANDADADEPTPVARAARARLPSSSSSVMSSSDIPATAGVSLFPATLLPHDAAPPPLPLPLPRARRNPARMSLIPVIKPTPARAAAATAAAAAASQQALMPPVPLPPASLHRNLRRLASTPTLPHSPRPASAAASTRGAVASRAASRLDSEPATRVRPSSAAAAAASTTSSARPLRVATRRALGEETTAAAAVHAAASPASRRLPPSWPSAASSATGSSAVASPRPTSRASRRRVGAASALLSTTTPAASVSALCASPAKRYESGPSQLAAAAAAAAAAALGSPMRPLTRAASRKWLASLNQ
ncbi:kinesin-like protein Klp5 [Cladochytrium tenue]|nr:kinesin-like protein Klp5 [Cladochytrium tenue]